MYDFPSEHNFFLFKYTIKLFNQKGLILIIHYFTICGAKMCLSCVNIESSQQESTKM